MFPLGNNDCIFCKIANGVIPSATVYEDDDFRVIPDMSPASRGHVLILPKVHFADICEAKEEVAAKLFPLAARVGKAMKKGLDASGFNVVQNNGASAGQTVFHLHVHVIPRYDNGSSMITWTPEEAKQEELALIAKTLNDIL